MAEKIINGRSVQKHDVEENWLKATNFTPRQGEIIIYDIDETYTYERIKIGDGTTNVNDLPFAAVQSDFKVTDEHSLAYIKNKPTEEDAMELLMEMNVIQPMADENGALYVDANNAIYVIQED